MNGCMALMATRTREILVMLKSLVISMNYTSFPVM